MAIGGAFRCTPRAEACNTSGTPYQFETETRSLKSCAGGCTIEHPCQAPNIVYWRVRRSTDGVNWTNNNETLVRAVP